MQKIKDFLNRRIETLFQLGMRKDSAALLLIRLLSALSSVFKGIWLFRRGDISQSLITLRNTNSNIALVLKCKARSEFILKQLEAQTVQSVTRKSKGFNNRVLMAFHSNGHYHKNGYAIRSSMVLSALRAKGVSVLATTRPGYPWDLSDMNSMPRTNTSTFDGQIYQHTYDGDNRISGPEDEYIDFYTQQLADMAKREEVTVIHAHSSYLNGIAASQAAESLGIKSVYEVRGLWHLSRAVKEPLFENSEHYQYCEVMEIRAAAACDRVVTLNQALKAWLVSKGVSERKIYVIPNGAEAKSLQERHNCDDVLQIGFFGSLTGYEGLSESIQAVKLCQQDDIKVQLNVYGRGDYAVHLKHLIEELDVAHQVKLMGHVDKPQLLVAYQNTDIVLVARNNLNVTRMVTPLKLVEAMLMKKACIVSDLPALTETVTHMKNAYVVAPDNGKAIFEGIKALHNDRSLMSKLGQNAYQTAINAYNWQRSTDTYLTLYTENAVD